MKLHAEPLTIRQLGQFLQNVRDADIYEAELASGCSFIDNPLVYFYSTLAVVDDTGRVFAIGGITDSVVWMLCTKCVEEHKITFLKYSKKLLQETLSHFPYLYNKCWLGNDLHVKWLSWLGCTWGKQEGDFRYFRFTKGDH